MLLIFIPDLSTSKNYRLGARIKVTLLKAVAIIQQTKQFPIPLKSFHTPTCLFKLVSSSPNNSTRIELLH